MTPLSTVERLESLLAKATPGPWVWDEDGHRLGNDRHAVIDFSNTCQGVDALTDGWGAATGCNANDEVAHANAALIAEAINALPELLRIARAVSADKADAWLPIETAPKDGSHVWLATSEQMRIAFWHYPEERWIDFGAAEAREAVRGLRFIPTHWQPLPAPPDAARLTAEQGEAHG